MNSVGRTAKRWTVALVCAVAVGFLVLNAWASATVYPVGMEYELIQDAINVAAAGSTIVISEGTYRENLTISKPLTIVGCGEVILIPEDRGTPAISVSDTADVAIHALHIQSAFKGIDADRSTIRIIDCSFHTTEVGVEAVLMDANLVLIQHCTFTGERDGVLIAGSGTVEIVHCEFLGMGTSASLNGLTSVLVLDCTFRDSHDSIALSSSVKATLIGNQIHGSTGRGIRVGPALYDYFDGPLVLINNVIENSTQWGLSLCHIHDADVLTFTGVLMGFGNVIDNEDLLCPIDYDWPEGFFVDTEPDQAGDG